MKLLLYYSIKAGRELVYFEVQKNGTFKLIPGSYESYGDLILCKPKYKGYAIRSFSLWIDENTN